MKKFLKENNKQLIFTLTVFVSLIVTLIFISKGIVTWDNVFFYDIRDGFMDFFNSIFHTFGGNIYENTSIYPPLIYYMYRFFGSLIPLDSTHFITRSISSMYEAQIAYMFYLVASMGLLIFSALKLNKDNKYPFLSVLGLLISFPVLYCFQRGNAIILAFIFLMFYFALNDSKNKFLKHLGLISLAVSANIKLYPALFGLLLLKDKRWKDAFFCIVYGLILFILPFFSFGGIESISLFLENLLIANSDLAIYSLRYIISFFSIFGSNPVMLKFIIILSIVLSVIPFIFEDKKWKNILLIIILILGIPTLSYSYGLMFLFIPLSMLINEKKSNIIDYFYLIIMTLLLSTLGFMPKIGDYCFFVIFERSMIFSLLIMLLIDGYIKFYKKLRGKKCQK